ncbi:MAG: hypothetical protein OWU84_12450 [Firmicutes bacterium]|nr:hypothetical protein [Bacillota bacterium]
MAENAQGWQVTVDALRSAQCLCCETARLRWQGTLPSGAVSPLWTAYGP